MQDMMPRLVSWLLEVYGVSLHCHNSYGDFDWSGSSCLGSVYESNRIISPYKCVQTSDYRQIKKKMCNLKKKQNSGTLIV